MSVSTTAVPVAAAGAVLAGITVAAAAAAASSGEPAGSTTTYTTTTPLVFGGPEGTGAPSPLHVAGAGTRVIDVDVALTGLSVAGDDRVDAVLVGPDGQRATVLEDGAAPDPSPAAGTLAVFEGTNPNGTWRLHVDDGAGSGGSLQGWSLQVTSHSPGDGVPPRVVATAPAQVVPGSELRLTLSEAVRPSTVTSSSVQLVDSSTGIPVHAAVTWRGDTRTVRIDPVDDLAPRTPYVVVVTDEVRDHAGNPLDQDPGSPGVTPKTWSFSTR